ASLVQQTSTDKIYVSSIFEMKFDNSPLEFRKTSSGYMTRVGEESCVMKIVMPFDQPPPFIEPQYLCRWGGDSAQIDSLCYTDFGCRNIEVMMKLSLLAPSLFIGGYLLLAGLVFYQRMFNHYLRPRIFWGIAGMGFLIIIGAFGITKIIPLITDVLFMEVFEKIREVTIGKGGVKDLRYDLIKYVLETPIMISRTLTDILAGFTAAYFFMTVEEYLRGLRKLKRPDRYNL
ncbi:MAG: hypothetical protein VKM97_07340, partial [Cyanobacteriota bacterium]|nr:hypothetical protein [Cyanobacteriota bacterium]